MSQVDSVTMLAKKKKNHGADLHINKNFNIFSDGYTRPSDPYADMNSEGYYKSITAQNAANS